MSSSLHDQSLVSHAPAMDATLDPTTPEAWDELRRVGHQMLDDMIDYLGTVRERPVWQPVSAEAKASLAEAVPREATAIGEVYDQFTRDILPFPTGNIHPRFWGWVMGTGTAEGMLGDLLAGAMNAHVAGYDQSASLVEKQVIRWLAELLGYPVATSGLLVSGGTAANLVGLTVARNTKAGFDVRAEGLQGHQHSPLRVYASTEVHSWAKKSCELLGLGRSALRLIPVNAQFEMDVAALDAAIAEDRQAGWQPICVIGSAGTVNTGATDDLTAIAAVCRSHDVWFHVDGAFGALAALAPALRDRTAGMALADSLAFDLHKWGYVQYEVGCVLVRDAHAHRATFATTAAYLQEAGRAISVEPLHFADLGIQLSRGFRALKVWMALKTQGADAWGQLIQQNVDQARYLAAQVQQHPALELLAPAPLNVVCFRYAPAQVDRDRLDALNREILIALQEQGIAVPSGTTVPTMAGPAFALRVANTNHRSRREDFDILVDAVTRIGGELTV